jgi:predicted Zn-dependent protease
VLDVASQVFGFGGLGRAVGGGASQLALLAYGREDETEGDLVGLDLAARAGYDPRAGVVLWQKMGAASKGAPPQWLSTHPSGKNRIAEIQKHLKEVMPLYAKAKGVPLAQLKPYQSNWPELAAVK